jgi:glycerol-3-phosphate dehydrogenase (NAD(P)+)
LSQVVANAPVAVLSGPNHAEEIAQGLPALAVLASEDEELATELQHAIISPRFRVYVNTDVVGVELCAASKNVMALAAGAVDGLEAGDNAKAALITRGLSEMARLGEACGARAETFAGLAGMGDLVLTTTGSLSRNRALGVALAQGQTLEEYRTAHRSVAEGANTSRAGVALGARMGVELPIIQKVCEVLFSGKPARDAVPELMGRELKAEQWR